jgi:hypothetical protein
MKKYIKSMSDLPDWFSMENYKITNNDFMKSESRYSQIYDRMVLYKAINNGFSKDVLCNEFRKIYTNVHHDIFTIMRREEKTDTVYQLFSIEILGDILKSAIKPVCEVTTGRALNLIKNVDYAVLDSLVNYELCDASLACPIGFLFQDGLQEKITVSKGIESEKLVIEVDLRASDKIILDQFSELLRETRKIQEKNHEISKNGDYLLGRINSYKIIPFIDICILWEILEDVSIKPALAAMIFDRTESEIYKTIKPLAYSLLDPQSDNFKRLYMMNHDPSNYLTWGWE